MNPGPDTLLADDDGTPCFRIHTVVTRGVFYREGGFLPKSDEGEHCKEVASLLTADAAQDFERWKTVLGGSSIAFYRAYIGEPQ